MLESLPNKNPALNADNFIENWLQRRCFPANTATFLSRTPLVAAPVGSFYEKIAVPKNSCSEKKLFHKIATLIDNLKGLL